MATEAGSTDQAVRRFVVDASYADPVTLVLYVPEIEASTSVRELRLAETAVRDLIAVLTGLDPAEFECDIEVTRRIPAISPLC